MYIQANYNDKYAYNYTNYICMMMNLQDIHHVRNYETGESTYTQSHAT